jgi:hypothetical protein
MNVLILTPDRVGSTLLQRLITVYMQSHTYNRPVINLHELTNGLMKYYSPVFNQEVLGKPTDRPWGYYQTLDEIVEHLHNVDHYKTARLAHYHIVSRQDSMAVQVPFYQYLNDNFFIISAQRKNLLEHALSWCIKGHSRKLNVYTHQEKIDTFADIYQNRITVDVNAMISYLNKYVNYLQWVENHFTVSSYFEYETHLPNIEEYILDLDIFGGQQTKSWNDTFGIEFSDWNRCHYLASDMSGLSAQLPTPDNLKITFDSQDHLDSVDLVPVLSKNAIFNSLSTGDKQFLQQHTEKYVNSYKAIDELVQHKILVTGVPIKLQTMMEKRRLIRNFDQCAEAYNQWVRQSGVGDPYTDADIKKIESDEISAWHSMPTLGHS